MKVIHATRPGLVLGFHGCERIVRDTLIKEVRMKPSRKPYDWLGNGCYLWENSYAWAYDFARNPPGNRVVEAPAVLGAVIDLQFVLICFMIHSYRYPILKMEWERNYPLTNM